MRSRLRDLSVEEFGDRSPDKRWLDVLKRAGVPEYLLVKLKDCKKIFRLHYCRKKGHAYHIPWGCNRRSVCYACSNAERLSRTEKAVDMFSRMERSDIGRFKYNSLVFTLPRQAWPKVDMENLNSLGRFAWNVFNQFLRKRSHRKMVFGGLYSVHICGSYSCRYGGNPLKGFYPHAHVLATNVGYDRLLNKWVVHKPWLDVNALRKDWSRAVALKYNVRRDAEYNFHNDYSDIRNVRKSFQYIIRGVVHDVYNYVRDGHEVSDAELPWLKRMLFGRPVKSKRYCWVGYLSDGVKGKYLGRKLHIRVYSIKEWLDYNRHKKCLIDGSELIAVDGFDGLTYIDDLPKDARIYAWSKYGGSMMRNIDVTRSVGSARFLGGD